MLKVTASDSGSWAPSVDWHEATTLYVVIGTRSESSREADPLPSRPATEMDWEPPPEASITRHEETGDPSGKDSRMSVVVYAMFMARTEGGIETGKGVGLGVEAVGGGADWSGGGGGGSSGGVVWTGGGGEGSKVASGGSSADTLVSTQRCSPPKSALARNTELSLQSLDALKKRLQPVPERSLKTMRYVPSSACSGTRRNTDGPVAGSMVTDLEAAPRHAPGFTADTGPTHLHHSTKGTFKYAGSMKHVIYSEKIVKHP